MKSNERNTHKCTKIIREIASYLQKMTKNLHSNFKLKGTFRPIKDKCLDYQDPRRQAWSFPPSLSFLLSLLGLENLSFLLLIYVTFQFSKHYTLPSQTWRDAFLIFLINPRTRPDDMPIGVDLVLNQNLILWKNIHHNWIFFPNFEIISC